MSWFKMCFNLGSKKEQSYKKEDAPAKSTPMHREKYVKVSPKPNTPMIEYNPELDVRDLAP